MRYALRWTRGTVGAVASPNRRPAPAPRDTATRKSYLEGQDLGRFERLEHARAILGESGARARIDGDDAVLHRGRQYGPQDFDDGFDGRRGELARLAATKDFTSDLPSAPMR
jgi:hypothetical protein